MRGTKKESVRQQRPQPRRASAATYQLHSSNPTSLHLNPPIFRIDVAAVEEILSKISAETKLAF